ncbi:Reverse transcriptase-like [Sesbania bispinosa]|nr:Reverse transcriptase-like [Sesbania bispinosa]
MAIFYGVKLPVDMGYRQIIMEIDSKSALWFLQSGCVLMHPDVQLIKKLQAFNKTDTSVVWQHIYKRLTN